MRRPLPWWDGGAVALLIIDHAAAIPDPPPSPPPPSSPDPWDDNGQAYERDLQRLETEGGPPPLSQTAG